MNESNGKKVLNTLTQAQHYKLTLWVDNNRDRIQKERLTYEEIARQAAEHLKFPVTKSNVMGAMEAAGVKSTARLATKPPGGGKYLQAVREQTAALEKRVEDLIRRVEQLEAEVTAPVPAVRR